MQKYLPTFRSCLDIELGKGYLLLDVLRLIKKSPRANRFKKFFAKSLLLEFFDPRRIQKQIQKSFINSINFRSAVTLFFETCRKYFLINRLTKFTIKFINLKCDMKKKKIKIYKFIFKSCKQQNNEIT